ncbi:MAG: NAD-dependent epimerase/dehydratase family protein [Methanopyri archaeon]|nr:NAD-dependent epimerase/dehydratase family protein [Methanopyri archaeon]
MSEQRVLVTGADGLVGTHLCLVLEESGHEVVRWSFTKELPGHFKVDVRDREAVIEALQDIDAVVHLAAITVESEMARDHSMGFDVNIGGTANVLEALRRRDVPRMVYLSSQVVYGNRPGIEEKDLKSIEPLSPYAESKYLAEELVRGYGRAYGIDVTVLRSSHIYGPGQRSGALVPLFLHRILEGTEVQYGNDVTRDLIYVVDAARAILAILPGAPSKLYNVGTGIETRISELISALAKVSGRQVSRIHNPSLIRDNALERWRERANIDRITDEVGWRPQTSLEDGLQLLLQHV